MMVGISPEHPLPRMAVTNGGVSGLTEEADMPSNEVMGLYKEPYERRKENPLGRRKSN